MFFKIMKISEFLIDQRMSNSSKASCGTDNTFVLQNYILEAWLQLATK